MRPMRADALAAWAGGRLHAAEADVEVGPGVVIDSRAVTPGALFVAIAGERVDGHDFVAQAAASGARAALVSRLVDAPIAQVLVDDTVGALAEVARHVVAEATASGLVVVGVTGSAGKTSTKDLIAQVLATAGTTVAPVGSFNNEIGAPLTACQVDADTRFLVAEMGARGLGHVAWLAGITPPSIGAVLNVGHAHLGEFGSQDVIAQAKGELVEALPGGGWAVLNADDERVAAMAARTDARIALFSMSGPPPDADLRVWAADVRADELQRYSFTLVASGNGSAPGDLRSGSALVSLRVLGPHNVANALAAATVALCAGLGIEQIATALSAATPRSKWRMQLDQRPDGLAVLNDAYNANPESMAAALAAAAALRRPDGRVVAVIGDMLELGESATREHRRIGAIAAEAGVDELLAVGEFGPELAAGFAPSGRPARYFATKDAVANDLLGRLGPLDVVLVKASRGIGLETVAETVLAEGVGP